jgi:hypothetical protein
MRNIMTPDQSPQQTNTPISVGGVGMGQNIGLADQPAPASIQDILNATDFSQANATGQPLNLPSLSTEANRKLHEALDMMPRRSDYKPSKFRKVLSSLASLDAKDPETQQRAIEEIQYKPYYDDLGDWQTHVQALMKGASAEDQLNISNRLMALGGIKAQQANRKLDQGDTALDIKQQEADARAYRIDAYAKHLNWLQDHPKWQQMKMPSGYTGNAVFYNPDDPTQTEDSGIRQNDITPDKLANIRADAETKAAQIRADAEKESARIRGQYGIDIKKTPTAKEANETPAQRKVRLYNRANQAINEHPEWKNYIRMDPEGRTGSFEVVPPGNKTWRNITGDATNYEKLHDDIYDYIYGASGDTPTSGLADNPAGLNIPKK